MTEFNFNNVPASKLTAAEAFAAENFEFSQTLDNVVKQAEDDFHEIWQRELKGEINARELTTAIFKLLIDHAESPHYLASLSRELTAYNYHSLSRTANDYAKNSYIETFILNH